MRSGERSVQVATWSQVTHSPVGTNAFFTGTIGGGAGAGGVGTWCSSHCCTGPAAVRSKTQRPLWTQFMQREGPVIRSGIIVRFGGPAQDQVRAKAGGPERVFGPKPATDMGCRTSERKQRLWVRPGNGSLFGEKWAG